MDCVIEEDAKKVAEEWRKIVELRQKVTFEMRVNRKTPKGTHAWVLASGMPEENEDGSLRSVMGCIADISLQKVRRAIIYLLIFDCLGERSSCIALADGKDL